MLKKQRVSSIGENGEEEKRMTAVKKERTTLTEKLGARKVRGLKYLLIAVPFIIYVFSFSYVPLMGWIYSV